MQLIDDKNCIYDFLYKYGESWREKNVINSMLNGGSVNLTSIDDLSDESFYNQIMLLKKYKKEIHHITVSQDESLIKKELIRSINFRIYVLENENQYYGTLSSYLKLVSMTLLLYEEKSLKDKYTRVMLLESILKWLHSAEERDVSVKKTDIYYFSVICKYIKKTYFFCDNSTKKIINEIYDCQRNWVVSNSDVSYKKKEKEEFSSFLSECYGINSDLDMWRDTIKQLIYQNLYILKDNNVNTRHIPPFKLTSSKIKDLINTLLCHGKELDILANFYEKFEVGYLPKHFDYFIREGFYLHNTQTSKLFLSQNLKDTIVTRKNLHFIYTFLTHEIYPGHHNHMSNIKNKHISNNIDFISNPMGLEGWAVISEQLLSSLGYEFELAVTNLRRLVPMSIYLENILYNEKAANKLVDEYFSFSPFLYSEYKRSNGFGNINISYTMGYTAFYKMIHDYKIKPKHIIEYGPLTPEFILKDIMM